MKRYKIAQEYAKLHHKQAGMTLIELTVVLMILIGLAGLLIPYVSGFMEKTHDSTTVSTIAELNNTIQRYQTAKLTLPKNLEALHDGTALYAKLQNRDYLQVLATGTGANHLANASLSKAGVSSVIYNDSATTDATFKSTIGNAVALATMTAGTDIPLTVLKANTAIDAINPGQTFYGQLSANLVSSALPLKNQLMYAFGGTKETWDTACTNYVVMGIGSASSLIPSAMQAAPVHFGGSAGEAPATVYARYVAVFAVPNGAIAPDAEAPNVKCPTADAPAKFIGTAGIMEFPALVGLNGAQQWANSNLYKAE